MFDELRRRLEPELAHATLLRGAQAENDIFHPLPGPLQALHQRLKRAFDPENIFNPGRLAAEL